MKEVFIATANIGKAKEFEALFAGFGYRVKTLLDLPELIDVEETGTTFDENARLKADTISRRFAVMTIADDSGLIVDALNGEPGVYSARYAGESKSDEANIQKVLEKLEGVPEEERTARFHCTLAVAVPGRETITLSGECEGRITTKKIGDQGFGYDPVFYVDHLGKTMAELTREEKAAISHRGAAIAKLQNLLPELVK